MAMAETAMPMQLPMRTQYDPIRVRVFAVIILYALLCAWAFLITHHHEEPGCATPTAATESSLDNPGSSFAAPDRLPPAGSGGAPRGGKSTLRLAEPGSSANCADRNANAGALPK